MIKSILVAKIFLVGLIGTQAFANCDELRSMDPGRSGLRWTGRKLTGSHSGDVKITKASVVYDGSVPCAGIVVVDMHSIATSDDLTGVSKERLIKHLKSEDFFDVARYPEARFMLKSCEKNGSQVDALPDFSEWSCKGVLTIKGRDRDLKFTAKQRKNRISGSFTFDRLDFDIQYRSAFKPVGLAVDQVIQDQVTLDFDLLERVEFARK